MYHCLTELQCNSSSTTAVHYTTYYYYTAALFAVCTYIARPPPLLFVHGYTQQQCQVLLILYLTYNTYYYDTPAVFAVCTYVIHHSPAAASVGYTRLYTAVVPGSFYTVPYPVAVCINTTFCSPLYVWYTATGMYYFLASPPSFARRRSCWLYTAAHSSTFLLVH